VGFLRARADFFASLDFCRFAVFRAGRDFAGVAILLMISVPL
jgi:hypothetical protein